ncbi:hypothetical protein HS088_TW12G00596 [Tripterygium wilfordii]|uniref:Uncharacterized protein n=1 Tax=Tripterygium wilfordii TaxID=458696 RepID=A0A7J7CZ54_TRIWF|nr:uncharacterized protein LOC120011495 [Tripterygium wilfordii]KAF5739391.1 hypothetical protein HS088_TW12G00596 [Tripterygium wilfordii]
MEDEYSTTTAVPKTATRKVARFGSSSYKFWILLAILLLASWSLITGSVTLKWSAGNLSHFPADADLPVHGDLDVLEVEEREKVVRRMWEVYTQKGSGRISIELPRFWRYAFEAAYEDLASDVPSVRDAAVSEIAEMSLLSINTIEPLTIQSTTGNVHGVV